MREPDSDTIILFDIDYTLFDTDAFKKSNLKTYSLYDEVFRVVKILEKHATLGILSEGETAFQYEKLIKTNLFSSFSKKHLHILSQKEESLEHILYSYKGRDTIIVDDKLPILEKAKQSVPEIFTIWIQRGPYALAQTPIKYFVPDAIIKSLREILPVLAARK